MLPDSIFLNMRPELWLGLTLVVLSAPCLALLWAAWLVPAVGDELGGPLGFEAGGAFGAPGAYTLFRRNWVSDIVYQWIEHTLSSGLKRMLYGGIALGCPFAAISIIVLIFRIGGAVGTVLGILLLIVLLGWILWITRTVARALSLAQSPIELLDGLTSKSIENSGTIMLTRPASTLDDVLWPYQVRMDSELLVEVLVGKFVNITAPAGVHTLTAQFRGIWADDFEVDLAIAAELVLAVEPTGESESARRAGPGLRSRQIRSVSDTRDLNQI